MSVPVLPAAMAATVREQARRLGSWSLRMLPLLLVSWFAAGLFGLYLLDRRGLGRGEPMSAQGAYGWAVWAASTLLFLAPAFIGVALGHRARRLGATGRGLTGMLANGLVLVGYPTLSFVGLLGE